MTRLMLGILVITLGFLSACSESFYHKRDSEYLSSHEGRVLRMPLGLNHKRPEHEKHVSNIELPKPIASKLPPETNFDMDLAEVSGQDSYLSATKSRSVVKVKEPFLGAWKKVAKALEKHGLTLIKEDKDHMVMHVMDVNSYNSANDVQQIHFHPETDFTNIYITSSEGEIDKDNKKEITKRIKKAITRG